MRKIIVGAQVSMDGVMQAPGGPTEDPTKGFKFGGWSMAYWSPEGGEEIMRLFNGKFDLLLGRKTYEIFAGYWPYYKEDAPAKKTLPPAASPMRSRRRRSTWFPARATSTRAGQARCFCATSTP